MPDRFERRSGSEVNYFCPADGPAGWLIAFSTRGHSPPKKPWATDFLARRLARSLRRPELPIVRTTQVHGTAWREIAEPPAPGDTLDAGRADILVTRLPNVALVVQTADCVPLLLASRGAAGAVHAGWRGTSAGVARRGLAALRALGTEPEEVVAFLGPSIGPCCYEVGPEVARLFDRSLLSPRHSGRPGLDLREANRRALLEGGVPDDTIAIFSTCTRCGGSELASYRRDGKNAGRMIALIARISQSQEPRPSRP